MRAFLLALVGLALLAIAPNALWLVGSTALVRNVGAEPVDLAIVVEDEQRRENDLGTLAPGDTRFLFVEVRGEATLVVEAGDHGDRLRHCGEYVEGAMYHVEIVVHAAGKVACRVELPLLDRLLLLELLRAQL